tara:strand:- start:2648 stop:3067 length:420 start_codon:yes stop_codon:yes gene_type:complete
MAVGEFEYVKPPHFYVEDTGDSQPTRTKTIMENVNDICDDETSPKAEIVEDQGVEQEIEIKIDDETSTTKIVVKETVKPTRGRTPKLSGLEEEVATKYREGLTLKRLGEIYEVSVPCVSNALKRAGEVPRSRGRQKKDL